MDVNLKNKRVDVETVLTQEEIFNVLEKTGKKVKAVN